MPVMRPAERWQLSGRWDLMGDGMFRLKDRRGADLALGMTHEEIVTNLATELESSRDLPHPAHRRAALPRPAADVVPDPDQAARRAAAEGRADAHPRVHHEGLLQL